MKLRSLTELRGKLKGKRVLLRTDYNVPLKKGRIVDDFRIKISLRTINFLAKEGAKITIITHLGRPKGFDESLSLKPIAKRLSKLTGRDIILIEDKKSIKQALNNQGKEIIMLENLRFNKGEETNSMRFAESITKYYDFFVFDAFSVSHRKHASTYAMASQLKTYAGFRFLEEIKNLSKVLRSKKKITLIVGGLKIKTKIGVINNFLKRSRAVLIGGAMMFTFLKAQGKTIGKSIFVEEEIPTARTLLKSGKIILPKDSVCAKSIRVNSKEKTRVFSCDSIPKNYIGLDIGPKTVNEFKSILKKSDIIVWNGPLGYYENPIFMKGTEKILKFLSKEKSYRLICGGDTLTAVRKLGITNKFDFVSSGGGASLYFLSGEKPPILNFMEK